MQRSSYLPATPWGANREVFDLGENVWNKIRRENSSIHFVFNTHFPKSYGLGRNYTKWNQAPTFIIKSAYFKPSVLNNELSTKAIQEYMKIKEVLCCRQKQSVFFLSKFEGLHVRVYNYI
jgi:hypothetical protein